MMQCLLSRKLPGQPRVAPIRAATELGDTRNAPLWGASRSSKTRATQREQGRDGSTRPTPALIETGWQVLDHQLRHESAGIA
jgi:hypothetical protein